MDMLPAGLKAHHTDVAGKIVGAIVVDARRTTATRSCPKVMFSTDFFSRSPSGSPSQ